MIELRDSHVVLRALERQDCHALWKAEESGDPPPTEHHRLSLASEGADKWFEEIQAKQGQSGVDFGVFDPDGRVVGHVQIHSIDWQNRRGEIGLGFARRADRGRGYGSSALRLIVGYGFDHLGLHRLAADTAVHNRAAIRVFEKCGFKAEGRQREAFFFGGRWHDRVCYSLLEEEFRKAVSQAGANDA